MAGETVGHGDLEANKQVPPVGLGKRLNVGSTLAGEPDESVWLGTGADFDPEIAIQGGHDGLATQNGQGVGNRVVEIDMRSFAAEVGMGLDLKSNIEISKTQVGTGVGAGGDFNGMRLAADLDRLGAAFHGCNKGNAQRIVGLSRSTAAKGVGATEKLFENFKGVGKAAKVSVAERISAAGRVIVRKRPLATAGGTSKRIAAHTARSGVKGRVTELVIGSFLLGVGEDLISFIDLFEFTFGLSRFIAVGVPLQSELAVGRLQLGSRRCLRDS